MFVDDAFAYEEQLSPAETGIALMLVQRAIDWVWFLQPTKSDSAQNLLAQFGIATVTPAEAGLTLMLIDRAINYYWQQPDMQPEYGPAILEVLHLVGPPQPDFTL